MEKTGLAQQVKRDHGTALQQKLEAENVKLHSPFDNLFKTTRKENVSCEKMDKRYFERRVTCHVAIYAEDVPRSTIRTEDLQKLNQSLSVNGWLAKVEADTILSPKRGTYMEYTVSNPGVESCVFKLYQGKTVDELNAYLYCSYGKDV